MITKVVFVILAVIALIGIAFYGYARLDGKIIGSGTPKIQVVPSSYDFGDIPKKLVTHTFTVKNTGNAPLMIKKVSTSCACTKATIEEKEIGPNQVSDLLVTFDPNIMKEDIRGDVLRIVYIKTNDPENPEVEIEIRANVME